MYESEFEKDLYQLRRDKLAQIEALGQKAYPNSYAATHTLPAIRAEFDAATSESLEQSRPQVSIAGRIMAIRAQGKAGFAVLQQQAAAAANLCSSGCCWRERVSVVQIARHGRPHRRYRLPFPHAHWRAERSRRNTHIFVQGDAGAAGKVSRPGRSGTALSPALRRSLHEPRRARGLRQARRRCCAPCAVFSTRAAISKSKRR